MYRIIKRDGKIADFDVKKISAAIEKAFVACEREYTPGIVDMIALRVTSDFEPKIKDGMISVEQIQDSVEKVLSEAGYADVAKAYILYRKKRENLRHIKDIKGCDLLMTTGEIVPLSQKKAADFRALLTRWLAQQV